MKQPDEEWVHYFIRTRIVDSCQRFDTFYAQRAPSIQEIEAAIRFACQHGWQFRLPGRSAHCFGVLMCPHNDKACRCGLFCRVSIWSTPANPQAHARSLRRTVEKCIHEISGDD